MLRSEILLPLYFIVFFLLAFFIRSVLVYRRTGVNPLVLSRTQGADGYIGVAFKALMLVCAGVVAILAFLPRVAAGLGQIGPLMRVGLQWTGWTFLLLSLVWMLVAQAQMGASWRIGIDSANRTELVSGGLFGISRNPIFLAMRLTLLGFFLVAPNAATLAILSTGEVLIQVQVRLEEQHLSNLHGEAYDHYCSRVPRWL